MFRDSDLRKNSRYLEKDTVTESRGMKEERDKRTRESKKRERREARGVGIGRRGEGERERRWRKAALRRKRQNLEEPSPSYQTIVLAFVQW